jgi:hypothetical protein
MAPRLSVVSLIKLGKHFIGALRSGLAKEILVSGVEVSLVVGREVPVY